MSQPTTLVDLQNCLQRYAQGDESARDEALARGLHRLRGLTEQMMVSYQRVGRWEEADDVLHNATMRLYRAMADVRPSDARAFLGLAALQIRRELIDLSRKHFGPLGPGRHHATDAGHTEETRGARVADAPSDEPGPVTWLEGRELHGVVERLPDHLREVVDLLFYHELTQNEASELLGVSTRTVKRWWREARLQLYDLLTAHDEGGSNPT